jgi:hypothetical protein
VPPCRLFKNFEEDEERTTRLATALEHESTAAALHFALFPRKTRDGGLQPTCREPVVSMMAFVVDMCASLLLLSTFQKFYLVLCVVSIECHRDNVLRADSLLADSRRTMEALICAS